MSLLKILTILFFIVTVLLFVKSKKLGNAYIPYGLLTFIFVVLYGYFPSISEGIIGLYTFIFFSTFVLLCGLTSGVIAKVCFKCTKYVNILSVVVSLLALLMIVKGDTLISYMYVPVLLFKWDSVIQINVEEKV